MNLAKEREKAKDEVIRFTQKWGRDYLDLACHAAFPLAITPELAYCLRENFLPECPWFAVADLTLSSLCEPVGDELYEMDSVVRDVLLRRLTKDARFGAARLESMGKFMGAYIRAKLPTNSLAGRDFGVGLEWVALAYIHSEDANLLREKIQQELQRGRGKVRERLASFLDAQEDLLIAAGLEPLLVSTQTQLDIGVVLETFEAEIVSITSEEETQTEEEYASWEFETVFVNERGEITETQQRQAYYFEELLAENVPPLVMVAIPEGEFMMGSPPGEKDRYDDEGPQHSVEVKPFFMAQTPITQKQWRVVSAMEQVGKELDPNPSNFESDDCPVERVSWYDAIEFCARLSRYTGKDYRLPSEAEWEYACRAVSNQLPKEGESPWLTEQGEPFLTEQGEQWLIEEENSYPPFHFGETLTTDLANYNGSVYKNEPEGKSRGQISPVKIFPPNAFGLYDMHGLVWEWCLDPWHESYENALANSRVWDGENNDNHYQKIIDNIEVLLSDNRRRVLRGGSWNRNPWDCRSAFRLDRPPDNRSLDFGFRVVCGAARTL
ncbi:MAG: formylglycine-generating enzyme family protein [Spirulinaceae cyanobacterium]